MSDLDIIEKFLEVGGPYLTILVLIIAWQFKRLQDKDNVIASISKTITAHSESLNRLIVLIDMLTFTRTGKKG